jgi:PKD repeat protein
MKKYLVLSLVLTTYLSYSQQFCHTDEVHHSVFNKYPNYNNAITKSYNKLEAETQNYTPSSRSSNNYIIPIVFHVIHNNGIENISEEQIKDQIAILNRDYSTYDTTVILDSFKQIVANCEIEFRLATIDPNGNCTNGITRHFSNLTLTGDHAVKSIVHWPPSKYLNFYVVSNAAGLAGHALLPYAADSLPHWDGIVMSHNSIGSIGTSNVQRSVVGSHEVGHYLNLQHVWGGNNVPNFPYLPVSNGGNCSYDDGVGDTPNTIGNQSCNLNSSTCSSLDNVQNFMDYSYCGAMFTIGQKNRMHAALNSTVANRNNLWSPANLIATGTDTVSNALCNINFESDVMLVCEGDSVTFWDKSYHKVISRVWSFEGGNSNSLTDSVVKVFYSTEGVYKVKLTVTNGIDTDSIIKSQYIVVMATTGNHNFLVENFESNLVMPNDNWSFGILDSLNWIVDPTVGYNSNQSLKYDGFNNSGKVEFISNTIDASAYTNMEIRFDYAFTQKELNSTDRLNVYYSNDCGLTWVQRKTYPSYSLLTKFPTDTSIFSPNGIGEWNSDALSINSAFLVPNLLVKFEFSGTSKGNNFYIDNINVVDPATISIRENTLEKINIYPNPSNSILNINNLTSETSIDLIDVTGKKIKSLNNSSKSITVSVDFLSPGIYFIQFKNKGNVVAKKFLVK